MERKLNGTLVRLQKGDLTMLSVNAFVFYAKETLELGSGFGTAIQVRGGDAVKKELEKIGRIRTGEAVITTAGKLRAKHIIHACGPMFQEPDTENKLRNCVLAALKVADDNKLKSVAFPPLGAGFYGVPLDVCATVMLGAIKDFVQNGTSLEEIIICAIDNRELTAFEKRLP